jgi:hypothetical protein
MTDKQPEALRRADELEDIGAVSKLAREIAAHTIRLLYSEKEWYRTKWVGLTDDEIREIGGQTVPNIWVRFAKDIEVKLKEKNAND